MDQRPSGCWPWLGFLNRDGYGQFSIGGRKHQCHRIAYEVRFGPIPDGMQIDHVKARGCSLRSCVNPDHLEVVTQTENLARGNGAPARNARKTHCSKGHRLDGENLYVRPNGRRRCRTCDRANVARRS